jgi:hypothetical protein
MRKEGVHPAHRPVPDHLRHDGCGRDCRASLVTVHNGLMLGRERSKSESLDEARLGRRRQLLEMLGAERNRLGQVFGRGKQAVRKSLKGHIAFLERELRTTDTDLG